jgi:dihydropyrimidinase
MVESGAVRRCLELAGKADAPAWIVHLSTKEGLSEIEKARDRGVTVLVETCPQYLTLTEEVYRRGGFEAAKYVCSPPIRNREARRPSGARWRRGRLT